MRGMCCREALRRWRALPVYSFARVGQALAEVILLGLESPEHGLHQPASLRVRAACWVDRDNWHQQPPKRPLPGPIANILSWLKEMTSREGLKLADLLAGFIMRRVSLLQLRPHLISQMSGRRDPSGMSTKEMTTVEVTRHVNYFSNSKLCEEEWHIGKEPHSRANPPPAVSTWFGLFAPIALFSPT